MHKSRRDVLLSVAAMAIASPTLAACDLLGRSDQPPPPDPLTDFYAGTQALAVLFETAALTDPQLIPIRDAHRAHAAALAAIMKPAPPSAISGPIPTVFATPPQTAGAMPSPVASPVGSPVDTRAELRTAQKAGLEKAIEVCLAAPTERVTLIGEIAAARACHLELLA